jgi:acyl-CoA synthetase (AMP-forming)/AMP-acid ligase II
MLVRDYLWRNSRTWPDRIAYVSRERRLSWREVTDRATRLATALEALGIGSGEVVCSLAGDTHEVAELWFACAMSGRVRVGINPGYSAAEIAHVLMDSGARAVVVEGGPSEGVLAEVVDAVPGLLVIGIGAHEQALDYETLLADAVAEPTWPRLDPDDIVAISYTTGTTGKPKGARWRHGAVVACMVGTVLQTGLRPDEVFLHCLPAAGVPIIAMTANVVNGSRIVIQGRFDAGTSLELIERERVTALLWVPTMLHDVLSRPEIDERDLSSLRLVIYGSSPATPDLVRRASSTLGCELQQWYGSTEGTLGVYAVLSWPDHLRALHGESHILSSCGRPALHCEVEIRDATGAVAPTGEIGDIVVRSETLMAGYHGLPDETEEVLHDGWLRTGDLGHFDEDGFLHLVDRRNFMIITGAYNVYPIVVENVLSDHPGVDQVCVVGVPDERWGEVVCAVVVPAAGHDDHDRLRAELSEFARPRLARFEAPKRIDFVAALPRGATGKVLKRVVRDGYRLIRQ